LNLKGDILVSKLAFKCNLYRYTAAAQEKVNNIPTVGGGLSTSRIQLTHSA
jgi:hypothetical protein